MIRHFIFATGLIFFLPFSISAQQITYSEYNKEDRDDNNNNYEIIGKMNSNIIVYKNIKWKHKLVLFDNEMKIKETVNLDFVPEKTLNVDFIAYPDFFYMIYQYHKNSILYCMGIKMDGNGKKMTEPFQMDTTQLPLFSDNKIYSTICSEDKKKIMVFKIQKKYEQFNIVTLLFNDQLQLINKTRQTMPFDERRDNFGEFLLDNDGNFVFTLDKQSGLRENSNQLQVVIKKPLFENFIYHEINLDKKYIDEVKLKIDNLNNRYIINSFYNLKSRGSIEGLFSCSWDKITEKQNPSAFNGFDNTFRAEAHTDGLLRYTFDNFFIRQVIARKDGGFLLTAEDFTSQADGNNNTWNRWDYFNNPSSFSSNSYYSYNPYYGYYRPSNTFSNYKSTRYYYANILVLSVGENGQAEWGKVIHKDQNDDDNEDFLSFSTMNSGGEVHLLFNMDKKNQVMSDQSISADGTIKRNATLKSQEKGYEFKTRLGKQVGAKQLIVPCVFHGNICFAKIDF